MPLGRPKPKCFPVSARFGGVARLVWLYLVPVFLVFPPAFALNRLGQHYDIVPGEPAKWGTRMARSPFWEFVYLWSNLHLEHHYYPAVPFYRLPDLNAALVPFFDKERVPARRYRDLLRGWILENRAPHSDWSVPAEASSGAAHPAPTAPSA